MITEIFNKVRNYTKTERISRLIELAVKKQTSLILPAEIIEMELIQEIRHNNGEIKEVIKNWEQNPDTDPRKQ